MPRLASLLLGLVVIALLFAAAGLGWFWSSEAAPNPASDPPKFAQDRVAPQGLPNVNEIPFDADRAIKYLKQLCDIGPRISGSDGMIKQRKLLIEHFEQHGAKVIQQKFEAKQKSRKEPVALVNLIARWHPERTRRIMLCAHYDTRPMADEESDPTKWNKPFLSANDGTSGVAFLMEMAHHLKDMPGKFGVDVVLFDAEEYIFERGQYLGEGDDYFLGSEHFAREYLKDRRTQGWQYEAAVLFDLFAAKDARLAVEGYSLAVAPNIVNEIWKIAEQLKAKSFKFERGFKRAAEVLDDHVPLQRAGIPAIDIIDFDYPHWHLLSDTPDKISPEQLAEVARVISTWLQTKQ